MPPPTPTDLGPLAALVGAWEGDQGLDVAFQHSKGEIGETPYRERMMFSPFGPVDNGTQALFGLDYRTAAWRVGEDEPFHTEVVIVTLQDDGALSYRQTTTIDHARLTAPLSHTDTNTLHRVDA